MPTHRWTNRSLVDVWAPMLLEIWHCKCSAFYSTQPIPTMKNTTTKAPLPFAGQKRNWVKEIKTIIAQLPPGTTFIDVFGGSGLIARMCKDVHPASRVIYNDHDYYAERLHHIAETEELRCRLFNALETKKIARSARIKDKHLVVDVVQKHLERYGYVDWITLSSWVFFTNNFARSIEELEKEGLWFRVSRTALSAASAERWLQGLEIIHEDWSEVVRRYKNTPNTLFIFDPPYLGTCCDGYANRVWTIDDYRALLADIPTDRFLYFSSQKMDYLTLLNHLVPLWGGKSPFEDARICTKDNSCCWRSRNPEILYYKI